MVLNKKELTRISNEKGLNIPNSDLETLDKINTSLKGELILLTIAGSRAYGTALEGKSDFDFRGIFIMPTKDVLMANPTNDGNYPYIPQISDDTNDVTYFEIGRFIELLEKGNPNILELLNVPEDCIVYKSPLFDKYFSDKETYITKKLKHTFAGYADSQIGKAKGMNKKVHNPQPKKRKELLDFCYLIDGAKTKKLKDYYKRDWFKDCGVVKLPHGRGLHAVYFDLDEQFEFRGLLQKEGKGVPNQIRLSSIPKKAMDTIQPISFYFDLDGYQSHCRQHKEYWEWVEKRNPERYKDNTRNENTNYDCYLDSETEYLTQFGWKKFDDIDDSCLLATLEKEKVVFHAPSEKVDKKYTGLVYTYEDRYTRFTVTPNHNLWLSKFKRNNNNKYSRVYSPTNAKWEFVTVEAYLKQKGESHYVSHLDIDYKWAEFIKDEWWLLAGAYLGDGHCQRKNGQVTEIRISQLETKELTKILEKYCDTRYKSKETKGGLNWIYVFKDPEFLDFISNFGYGSKGKRIPHYFYNTISELQTNMLIKGLLLSDGTTDKKGNSTYYSTNKGLVDDIQLLLIQKGYYCQLYEVEQKGSFSEKPYKIYHLYIPKNWDKSFRVLQKKNFTKRYVENERITCFTVPNHILITRNNNKIAVQGNTKNMMHCVRLVEVAEDVVNKKEIIVKRPNRDYLLSIRMGEHKYEDLLKYVTEKVDNLKTLFQNSDLPESVDSKKTRKLLQTIRLEN